VSQLSLLNWVERFVGSGRSHGASFSTFEAGGAGSGAVVGVATSIVGGGAGCCAALPLLEAVQAPIATA